MRPTKAAARVELPGLSTAPQPVANANAKFDLSLALSERRASDGAPAGIDGVLEYAADLFDEASVAALGVRLIRLLARAAADPDRALGDIDILDAAERHTILRDWNDHSPALVPAIDEAEGAALAVDATLPELFAAQATRTPDAVAVVFGRKHAELRGA